MMYEYEEEFPDKNTYICPPLNSTEASNIIFYKCSDTDKLPSDYMLPLIERGNSPNTDDKRCQMCAHSVFLNIEDITNLLNKKSKLTKGVKGKWKYIFSFDGAINSKFLHTPSKMNKQHYTYWHYGRDDIKYVYISEIND